MIKSPSIETDTGGTPEDIPDPLFIGVAPLKQG